jgi:hypothetical protein
MGSTSRSAARLPLADRQSDTDKETERQQWACSLVPVEVPATLPFTVTTKRPTPCEFVFSPSLFDPNFTIPL